MLRYKNKEQNIIKVMSEEHPIVVTKLSSTGKLVIVKVLEKGGKL
jgi:hypothetical protein